MSSSKGTLDSCGSWGIAFPGSLLRGKLPPGSFLQAFVSMRGRGQVWGRGRDKLPQPKARALIHSPSHKYPGFLTQRPQSLLGPWTLVESRARDPCTGPMVSRERLPHSTHCSCNCNLNFWREDPGRGLYKPWELLRETFRPDPPPPARPGWGRAALWTAGACAPALRGVRPWKPCIPRGGKRLSSLHTSGWE